MAIIKALEKDQVEEIAKEVYEKFESETGKAPEWVKVMAHSPKILKEFTELFKVIMAEGEIKSYLKWKIAYTVSEMLRCPFCVDVTTKMLERFGATEKMMRKTTDIKELKEAEKEILELVKDVTDDAHLDQPEIFQKLKEKFNEAQIVEIISVIGLFNYINRFNNTFGVLPE